MVANKADTTWINQDVSMSSKQQEYDFIKSISLTLEYVKDAVLTVNKDWEIIYINESAEKLLKLTKEKLIGAYLWDKFSDSVRKKFYDAYQESMLEDRPVDFSDYYSPQDAWLNFKIIPSRGGVSIILSENKEASEENTVDVYRSMFENYPDAVCSMDKNGHFLTVNKAFRELFEVDEKGVKGKRFAHFLLEKKQQMVTNIFNSAVKGDPQTVEINLSNEIGRPFVVMLSVIPILINSGIIGTYAILKDITKYYLNVDEIRRLYDMNQSIMESVEDGILGLDKNFNVVMWNEAAERITGYHRDELNQESIFQMLQHILPSIDHFLNSDSLDLFDELLIEQSGITFYRKGGSSFITDFTVTPMISGETIIGSVLTFRDITEKKKSEELIHQSEKLSAVGQLAAGIAHEIRNPLTSLKGFLQLIEFNQGGKKEYYDIMKSEFSRIEQILNELLILSKPQTLERETTSIVELMEHTVTLLRTQAIIKNIEIKKDIKVHNALVECAEHQIKQVFVNLIKNAIEATDNGGQISVMIEEEIDEEVIVRIIDNGCGIPKEKLQRIGEPFYTTKENGTGLGLMVTFQIIEEHGGSVHVDSIEGEGTTFIIKLPLQVTGACNVD